MRLLLLDPKRNSSTVLQTLFAIQESWRNFSCPLKDKKHEVDQPPEEKTLFVLQMSKSMFEQNSIPCSNVASLIAKWSTSGLDGGNILQCQHCKALWSKKKSQRNTPNGPEHRASSSRLIERSVISYPKFGSPPHLYFQVDAVPIIGDDQKLLFT
jgi:hypothetical protein